MSTVAAPSVPLYQMGWLAAAPRAHHTRPRRTQTIYAPNTPIYQLGYLGSQNLAGAAPVAVSVGTTTAGKVISMLPIPGAPIIGAAVIAIGAIISGLLAGHEQRAKQAHDENSAMNIGVQSFDSDVQTINQAYKAGQIDANGAIQGVQTALQGYWTIVGPHIQPGRNGCNTGTSCPPPSPPGVNPCHGSIGASCCVGCFNLLDALEQPDGLLAAINGQSTNPSGKYVARVTQVYGSSYGGQARAEYTVDWTPPAPAPAPSMSSVSSAVTSIESALTGSGGSSSLLPLLALAALAVLL